MIISETNMLFTFKQNKYTRLYFAIVQNASVRVLEGSAEKHHIQPKSLGGSNNKENIVKLTSREHYVCHKLLVKMLEGPAKAKMVYALWRMSNKPNNYQISSREYDKARQAFCINSSKLHKHKIVSDETKEKMRGKRPHFVQGGTANNNYHGQYVTPWGIFGSASLAKQHSPFEISHDSVNLYCRLRNEIPFGSTRKGGVFGKTPRELGYGFVAKEKF